MATLAWLGLRTGNDLVSALESVVSPGGYAQREVAHWSHSQEAGDKLG